MSKNVLVLSIVVGVFLAMAVPASVVAQPGPGEKEYCFCTTPRNNQAASGKRADNVTPSVVRIRWRGMYFEVMPNAGDTAQDVMQNLRDQVAAAFPGDTVGPVSVDTMGANIGRAVFCVKGNKMGIKQVKARETDSNFRTTTFRRVRSVNNPFLRDVGGSLVSADIPQGGDLLVEVLVEQGGVEQTISVPVPTTSGQTGIHDDIAAALITAGFAANVMNTEVDQGIIRPAFIVDRGIFERIEGIGITSNDLGIDDLAVFATDPDVELVPAISHFGLATMVILVLVAGVIVLRRGRQGHATV